MKINFFLFLQLIPILYRVQTEVARIFKTTILSYDIVACYYTLFTFTSTGYELFDMVII
jgi:hypothetical protein